MILGRLSKLGVFGAKPDYSPSYFGYNVVITGKVNRLPNGLVGDSSNVVTLYQHSDGVITVPIISEDFNVSVPASVFSDAEYVIATNSGKVKLRLTLGNGISVDGNNFKIIIDDGAIGKNFRGAMTHQFVVYNQAGDKLPPVFQNKLRISPVIL